MIKKKVEKKDCKLKYTKIGLYDFDYIIEKKEISKGWFFSLVGTKAFFHDIWKTLEVQEKEVEKNKQKLK